MEKRILTHNDKQPLIMALFLIVLALVGVICVLLAVITMMANRQPVVIEGDSPAVLIAPAGNTAD